MLDIKTLMLLNFIINLINACVLLVLWRQYHKYFRGLFLLFIDMLFQMLGFILSSLRGILNSVISLVFSNMLIVTGALLVLIGLEKFFNLKSKHLHNYIFLTVFSFFLSYFSLVDPNLTAREISISAMVVIINGQSCWLLFHRVTLKSRQMAIFPGIILLAFAMVSFIRIILLYIIPNHVNNFFQSDYMNLVVLTTYLALSVLLAISLIILVSRRLLEEVRVEKDKYNLAFNASPYAILLTRLNDGKIFEVNEGFTKIFGYIASEVIGKTTLEINLWDKEQERSVLIEDLRNGNTVSGHELRFRDKNGKIIIGVLSSNLIDVNNEKCILTSISDITEMFIMRQEVEELATHDFLTGLPNRKLFYDRFEIAKANAQRENVELAIISMDIDLLKSVNDNLGHDAGDQVLVAIGNRLKELLRKVDTVSRFGGDEFVLLIWSVSKHEDIEKVVSGIQNSLSKPISIGETLVNITVSIGIAFYPTNGKDIRDVLIKSDAAMYQAKKNGRNNHQYAIE
ncbi:MAG: diguanylate cyclase [Eubacteriales bacterium]